jgi:hypothetical protein
LEQHIVPGGGWRKQFNRAHGMRDPFAHNRHRRIVGIQEFMKVHHGPASRIYSHIL